MPAALVEEHGRQKPPGLRSPFHALRGSGWQIAIELSPIIGRH
jgi:hypothetical protein